MYVRARVTPQAKKETVVRVDGTTLEITVREPAVRNLANTRVRELVAEVYAVPSGKVRMISGHRSSTKVFAVDSG